MYTNNNFFPSSQNDFLDANIGYIQGNMQKSTYGQYKNYVPKEIKPQNEREAKLLFIQKCDFAINDLMLYLDIHEDEYLFKMLNYYRSQYNKALSEYQNEYGIIRPTCIEKAYTWNKKFPWEVM